MPAFYDLKLTQSWRGKNAQGQILDLHWALTIQTSGDDEAPFGRIYNAAGNMDTFFYERIETADLKNNNWRGALLVGRIPSDRMPELEEVMAKTPVLRHDLDWNCQNWVYSALRGLRAKGFEIKRLTWESLRAEMFGLLEQWENGEI